MDSADEFERSGDAASADPGRRYEAFQHLCRALELDPLRGALLPRLRALASSEAEKGEVERLARRPASLRDAVKGAYAYPLRGGGAALRPSPASWSSGSAASFRPRSSARPRSSSNSMERR